MIGSTITATLWQVQMRWRDLEAEASAPAGADRPIYRQEQHLVTTASPDGSDIFEVARAKVIREPKPEHDFWLVGVQRLGDLGGTAMTGPTA